MKRIRQTVAYAALIMGMLLVPVVMTAQDATENPPTDVAPTVESTVEPTVAPEPTPEPEPPVDVTIVPSWVFVVITVLILGVVMIAWVGIVQAAKGMPEWSQALLLSVLKSAADQADKVAKGTETTVDDATVAELRRRIDLLEQELKAVANS